MKHKMTTKGMNKVLSFRAQFLIPSIALLRRWSETHTLERIADVSSNHELTKLLFCICFLCFALGVQLSL